MIYCIDSNVIIWGIKRQASAGQQDMIARAELLFSNADEYQDYIVIPTVVAAEILAPELPEVRTKYLEILKKSFIVAPFDERAALKYAEILHNRFEEVRKIANETGVSRQRMKVDHMIIATAIVNNANCIYTTDGGLKTFANGLIDVRDLPTPKTTKPGQAVTQTDMFQALKIENDGKSEKEDETTP